MNQQTEDAALALDRLRKGMRIVFENNAKTYGKLVSLHHDIESGKSDKTDTLGRLGAIAFEMLCDPKHH